MVSFRVNVIYLIYLSTLVSLVTVTYLSDFVVTVRPVQVLRVVSSERGRLSGHRGIRITVVAFVGARSAKRIGVHCAESLLALTRPFLVL